MVERQIGKVKDAGSRSGGAAFDTFRLGGRSSTFVKICRRKFDIYSKIFYSEVGKFVRHPSIVDCGPFTPFRMLNFSVNFLYSLFLSWIIVCNIRILR
jgi:hypothetical protein